MNYITTLFLLLTTGIASAQLTVDAGNNYSICLGDTAYLGGAPTAQGGTPPYTYNWSPSQGLNSSTISNPHSEPTATTTYTVTVTDANNTTRTDVITVTVNQPPIISGGPNITIYSGQSATLQGSGGVSYIWWPNVGMNHNDIQNPSVVPWTTTTYYVAGYDANGCVGYAAVTVTVIETDSLFIYNAFSPNGDGDNDFFVIGNIEKFPENSVVIYNRYGREIYRAKPYLNNWNGRFQGEEVSAATYYYIVDTGTGKPLRYGSITIIR